MKLTALPAEFEAAKPVLDTIIAAGYEAYFVGGSVRDTILGKPLHDVDIATSAFPAEVKQLFKRTVDTGIEHGTVMILDHGTGYETTTFRTESGYQDFRRPDQVTFVRSLKEDLQRRDFTINALAMKPDGTVIDMFDGLKDLDAGILRAVGVAEERFHEDALRMMRAVRFASQLDFEIEPQTQAAIADNAALLTKIAVERTRVEWEKLLMGQRPQRGLRALLATALYRYLPGMAAHRAVLADLMDNADWHLPTIEAAWTLLAWITERRQSKQVRQLLKQWKTSNELIVHVTAAVSALASLQANGWLTAQENFATGLDALTTANQVAAILGFGQPLNQLTAAYHQLPIHDRHELAVNGGDLIRAGVVTPGPAMGTILQACLTAVIDGQVANKRDALLDFSRMVADTKSD